jgi:hypothetical protein
MISSNGRDVSASLPTDWAMAGVPKSAATEANNNRFALILVAATRTATALIGDFEPPGPFDLKHLDNSFRLRLRDIYIPLAIVYELLSIDWGSLESLSRYPTLYLLNRRHGRNVGNSPPIR